MLKIDIREMDTQSALDCAELEAQCFSSPWPKESFLNILNNNAAAYFVAYCDNTLVGYIGIFDLIDEFSIINIAVSPVYRRRGIAKLLMQRVHSLAKQRNCPSIALEVRESNLGARALYESFGYKEYGRDKKYYSDPTEDAILYRFNN